MHQYAWMDAPIDGCIWIEDVNPTKLPTFLSKQFWPQTLALISQIYIIFLSINLKYIVNLILFFFVNNFYGQRKHTAEKTVQYQHLLISLSTIYMYIVTLYLLISIFSKS